MDVETLKEEKAAARRPAVRAAKVDLEIILEQHRDWVKSSGRAGRQADLSRVNLDGADLTDTNLQGALLNETVLKGADLLLTDLQGASLLQANLQGANLLGARLREANLQGALLEGATGLLAAELAGANLTFAKLPAEVAAAQDLKYVSQWGRHARWLITALLLLNALACWRILTFSDAQLFQVAAGAAHRAGPRGESSLHSRALLGRPCDDDALLGAVPHAAGPAGHDPAGSADRGHDNGGDSFSAFGGTGLPKRRCGISFESRGEFLAAASGFDR